MGMSFLIASSMPRHQKCAFTIMRRNPSLTMSCEAPCVVANTRDVGFFGSYWRTHATEWRFFCFSFLVGGESGVIPSSTWPRASVMLPSLGWPT